MTGAPAPVALQLPLKYLGSINVWLLQGEPLTLVDTGPATDDALAALEQQLALHGVACADIELVLLTHHHLDHSALAATIKERSGATIAAHRATAQWGQQWHQHVAAERDFTRSLIARHGVPDSLADETERFFAMIASDGAPYEVDLVLRDGQTIRAGDRTWRRS